MCEVMYGTGQFCSSMEASSSEGPAVEDCSRIECAKQLLYAYINRCKAYRVRHAISFVPFSSGRKLKSLDFTDQFNRFQFVVDDVEAAGGSV
jgi:hypothetical protein